MSSVSKIQECYYAYDLEDEMWEHMKSTHMWQILQDRENSYFFEK